MPPYYLYAHSHYLTTPQDDLRAALSARAIDSRRLSRLTRLALLGTHHSTLAANGKLLLTSPFASPTLFARTFRHLLTDNLPSPLDFIANLHNAAAFHLAQRLPCHGGSLFIASDADNVWQALWLAGNELIAGASEEILLCWLYEAPPGADETEGCISWHLGRTPRAGALASLHLQTAPSPAHTNPQTAFLAPVEQASTAIRQGSSLILPAPTAIHITPL